VNARENLVEESNWGVVPTNSRERMHPSQPRAKIRVFPEGAIQQGAQSSVRHRDWRALTKRALDLGVAIPLFLLLSPLLALLAVFIRLDSAGPAVFRQKRTGLHGRPFEILKFRTLSVMEEGDDVVQVRAGDLRITRAGRWLRKTSLDELPQLLNVIRGEMSLVGPRPHAVAHDRYYAALIEEYAQRWRVKPGITGWAQVNGLRGETRTVEVMQARIRHDIWYASHADIALDLRILFRTPVEILRHRNAY